MKSRLSLLLLGLRLAMVSADCGCTSDESCCADDTGYTCCVDQESYCVRPGSSASKNFPARCCPQWTVGCSTGSVGCCDPARPWQRQFDAFSSSPSLNKASAEGSLLSGGGVDGHVLPHQSIANVTAFALFSSGSFSDLNCLTINAASGDITNLVRVSGPASDYFALLYGETTRIYPFAPSRQQFLFLDIVQTGATSTSPITLYTIDPATGESSATEVSGASGNVMGYDYHPETDRLIFSTGSRNDSSFSFFSLDLDSTEATKIAEIQRGDSEASPAFYAPYISALDSTGSFVFRLGYLEVTTGSTPGLGVTPLSTLSGEGPVSSSDASWEDVPADSDEDEKDFTFLYSLVRQPGTDSFLSLVPTTGISGSNHSLSVVQWARGGDTSHVLLDLSNAHPPGGNLVGNLGYIADAASESTYVALVVSMGKAQMGQGDRWEIVTIDTASETGGSAVLSGKSFDPLGAEAVTVSGIGIKS